MPQHSMQAGPFRLTAASGNGFSLIGLRGIRTQGLWTPHVYEMYVVGELFFKYYRRLIEAVYKDKRELELVT